MEKIIKIFDIDQIEKEVEIIGEFSLSNDKNFVLYTDNIENENNEVFLAVSEVIVKNNIVTYAEVNQEDLIEINEYINKFTKEDDQNVW